MRITEQTFKIIKGSFLWRTTGQVAAKHDISYKTAAQIKVSRNFEDYTLLNKAQHPEPQYSLADRVKQIHNLVFNQHDNKYLPPQTAREAARELEVHFLNNK
jgi:hypothetical protein